MRRLLFVLIACGSTSFLAAQSWSVWKADAVFPRIQVRARCSGFNEFANRFVWDVQLRNTYQKNVDLSWAAEPERLRGAEAQADQALGVKPGEIVDAHHTVAKDCTAGLLLRVNGVKAAGSVVAANSFHPKIEGRWQSKDPEPLRKELVIQLDGRTVTSKWSSPQFSFVISTPIPERVSGSVSIEPGEGKH